MKDLLDDSRAYWDRHAQRDPLWAILSVAAKRDGKWDVGRFFQTGTSEIDYLLYELDAQAFALRRGSALDFGCGVGRLAQALAPYFERVVGVDVSPSMVNLAARLNQHPQTVSYIDNQAADLRIFDDHSFDFIVSSIVLHHVPPDLACSYLREFLRVLTPAGIAVFQLPSHRRRAGVRPQASIAKQMPDDAYRASLVVTGLPRAIVPGSQVTLQVEVANLSMFDRVQRESGVLGIGNHWLEGGSGRMLTRDDGRTKLPATLRAGQTCRLPLTINAPATRGEYRLEVDVAHEGVLWFQDRGSDVARLAVVVADHEMESGLALEGISRVEPPPSSAAADVRTLETTALASTSTDVDDPGEFPMYGVPLQTVATLIAGQGATLVHIDNDRSGGEEWVSYRYFVRAAGSQ